MKKLVCALLICATIGLIGCGNVPLNSIETDGLKVEYSKGYMEKGKVQFDRIKGMQDYYKTKKGLSISTQVQVVDKKLWEKEYSELPYGLPFVMPGETPIIVLPATDDGVVAQSGMSNKEFITEEITAKLNEIGYDFDTAVKIFPDLVGLHEVGHTLVIENGNTGLNNWFNEFMATYYAYAYMRENDTELAGLWEANALITYVDGSKPGYTEMKDLDENYTSIDVNNYDWYQKQFTLLAQRVYEEFGVDFADKVRDSFGSDEVDSDEAFKRLREISPLFDEWQEELNNKFK